MTANTTTTTTKGEQTQQTLITVACHLFLERGYHGTSMRQIATAADLALSGIYNHFAGKEEIFRAVVRTYHPFLRILPKLAEVDAPTAEEMIHTAVGLALDDLAEHPEIVNLIFVEMTEFQGKHMTEIVDVILPDVLGFVGRLQTKPDLRPLPPLVIFRTMLSFLIGFVITGNLLREHPEVLDTAVTRDLYLDGLKHGLITS